MDYKKAYTVSNIGNIAGFLMITAAVSIPDGFFAGMLMVAGIAILSASVGITVKYFRCPHCDESLLHFSLGWQLSFPGIPPFCPHCGGKLREDAK